MHAKETLAEWLAAGDLKRTLAGLRIVCKKLPAKDLSAAVDFESGRFHGLENQYAKGVVPYSDYLIEAAKIRLSTQGIIDRLPDDWFVEELNTVPPTPNPATPSMANTTEPHFWRKMGYIALVVGIISGLVAIFQPFCGGGNGDSLQLTVFVQGVDGKPIPGLQNKGQLIVDFGNDRRAPLIGEHGRTNLGEIPEKFRGETIPIVLQAEGYEPAEPGRQYVMDGKPIYFTVQRDNSLGLIQGIVKDRSGEILIAGARILVDNDTFVYTDSLGRFRLQLPPAKQRDTYYLSVQKAGFKTKNEYYKPNTVAIEVRLDL